MERSGHDSAIRHFLAEFSIQTRSLPTRPYAPASPDSGILRGCCGILPNRFHCQP